MLVLLTLRARLARNQPRRNLTAEREEYVAAGGVLVYPGDPVEFIERVVVGEIVGGGNVG